jgi:hypothetical protein
MKKSDLEVPNNPRTQRIVKQLRAENPTATSDLEALIFDYRKTQAQDRNDIKDLLDQERVLRQQQADLVADLQDKERRFQDLDVWAKEQGMTPADTKDTAADIAAGKKPSLPLTKKEPSAEKPAVKSKAIRKKKDDSPETPAAPPAKADDKKPIKRRKARKPTPRVKAEPTKSPAIDRMAQDLTADPEQGDLFAEPVPTSTPAPTQAELPLRGGSNVVAMPKSTVPTTTQPVDAKVLSFPTRSATPPWDPKLMKTGTDTRESVFRTLYNMLQEEIIPMPGAMAPQPKLPNQDMAIQKAGNLLTLIVRGDPNGLIPDVRNDIQRLGYRFTKKPNGAMVLVHTETSTQVPFAIQRLPQDVQQAITRLSVVKEQQPGKPRARRLHYFTVDSPRIAQEYGLTQDKLGNWMMIEYDRSGEPFRRRLQDAIRIFGQPRSMNLNETQEELTANKLLYAAAAKYMLNMSREGTPIDYEQAIKLASKHYNIPYAPSELPTLKAKRAEIDRQIQMIKQAKQAKKQRELAKSQPVPGEEEYWKQHALKVSPIKNPSSSLE